MSSSKVQARPPAGKTAELPMRDFAHSLPMALLRAREAVMSRFRPMLREHGVTEQQWRVLRVLAETSELEVTELAQRSFILPPSLSRILQNLENRGLLQRTVVKEDQRRALISITPQGRRLFQIVAPHSEDHYQEIAAAVGDEKLALLYDLLDELESSLLELRD